MGELTSKNKTLIKENQELEAKVVQLASSYAAETSNKESKLEKLKQKLSESGNASSQQLRDLQLKLLETEKLLAAETAKYNQSEKEIEECLEEMERMRKGYEGDAVELFNVKQSKEEQDKKMQELATNYGQEAQECHRLRKQVESLVKKSEDASQQLQDVQQKQSDMETNLASQIAKCQLLSASQTELTSQNHELKIDNQNLTKTYQELTVRTEQTITELTSKNKTLIKENQELEAKVVQLASSYAAETSNKESK